MSSPNETPAADTEALAPTGVNPYSTGGGGVTFARRVAATYLASMLTRRVGRMQGHHVAGHGVEVQQPVGLQKRDVGA